MLWRESQRPGKGLVLQVNLAIYRWVGGWTAFTTKSGMGHQRRDLAQVRDIGRHYSREVAVPSMVQRPPGPFIASDVTGVSQD
jgi:hypothetical protein